MWLKQHSPLVILSLSLCLVLSISKMVYSGVFAADLILDQVVIQLLSAGL
jgi:hypothetical protein